MSSGDFELHGHFDIFFLGVNRSSPERVQHSIKDCIEPWDDFMVHGVKNPSNPVYTMHHEIGPWKMAPIHGPSWWSNFHGPISFKKHFTKPLGPSLDVNCMSIKRNDHAPKSECAKLFNLWPNDSIQYSQFISLLLSSCSLPKNNSIKNYCSNIFIMGFDFYCCSTSFASPTAKLIGPC